MNGPEHRGVGRSQLETKNNQTFWRLLSSSPNPLRGRPRAGSQNTLQGEIVFTKFFVVVIVFLLTACSGETATPCSEIVKELQLSGLPSQIIKEEVDESFNGVKCAVQITDNQILAIASSPEEFNYQGDSENYHAVESKSGRVVFLFGKEISREDIKILGEVLRKF